MRDLIVLNDEQRDMVHRYYMALAECMENDIHLHIEPTPQPAINIEPSAWRKWLMRMLVIGMPLIFILEMAWVGAQIGPCVGVDYSLLKPCAHEFLHTYLGE